MKGVYEVIAKFEQSVATGISAIVSNMVPKLLLFAGVLTIIYIAYKVIKSWMGDNERLDAMTLVRPCLVLASLALYQPLVKITLTTPVEILTDIVISGASVKISALNASSAGPASRRLINEASRKVLMHQQESGGPDGGGVKDVLQVHPVLEFINLVVYFLAYLVGGYIMFRQLVVKTIYFVLGPFALALSLAISNEKVVANWFQSYLSVLLWEPVLFLIQLILIMIPVFETENYFNDLDFVFSIAFQAVMIFVVFRVPQYANALVAQGSAMGQQAGNTIIGQVKSSPTSYIQNRKQRKMMSGQ